MNELEQLIADVAGDDTELAGVLRERLGKNATAAKRLSDGYLRQADYTVKTQALASEKAKIADQVKQYETALDAAEKEKDAILRDLSKHKLSTAQAQTLLEATKSKYGLSDEDIPGMADLIKTRQTGKPVDSTPEIDIDTRLKNFKVELLKEVEGTLVKTLVPELSSMASLDVIWDDINYEHQQLYGKRLDRKEKLGLIEEARKANRSIESVWDEKYGVSGKRSELHDKSVADRAVEEFKKKQADERTAEAMSGLREAPFKPSRAESSPLLRKDFSKGKYDQSQTSQGQAQGQGERQKDELAAPAYRDAESRAERLFETFQRRRSSGVGMGQPEPERKTA